MLASSNSLIKVTGLLLLGVAVASAARGADNPQQEEKARLAAESRARQVEGPPWHAEYEPAVLATKPVLFWRMDARRDGTIPDATSSGRDGTVEGYVDTAVQLARPDQAASVRNFCAVSHGGRIKSELDALPLNYSVSLWFRNDLGNTARAVAGYLFSRGPDGDSNCPGDHLGIGGTHRSGLTGKLMVFNGNRLGGLVAGKTTIQPRTWNHVVMVRSGQRVKVYLNGDTKPEIDADLPPSIDADEAAIFVGGRSDNFSNLQGCLDEVAVYDRALDQEDVQRLYQAAGVKAPTLPEPEPPVARNSGPLSLEQALESIHVPAGFSIELVAAEPLVLDPVAIDWGPDGKLWVAEMADYPEGIDGKGKPGGRIRFLEDTTGDGRYDRSVVFLDGLNFPNGVMAWNEGVLVTAAPEIFYAEDTDGDGKADVRQTLFQGFLEGNQQLRINGLRWGLDNWIHCASGAHHGGYGKDSRITSTLTGRKITVGSRDIRIRPDQGLLAPQSGPSQFGRNRDDWGNWFGVQNSRPLWHYVLADRYIGRNPNFAPADPRHQVVTPLNPPVYPATQPQKRFHSFQHSGCYTSACSAMIYRDDLLFARRTNRQESAGDLRDAPLIQDAFTCEPFHNLVQHNRIIEDGVSFRFEREPSEGEIDFFASEDRWCRPVMVRTGPDGALWVVDMYRYMIEHPQWLPQVGKDELRPFYRDGDDRGRIYRIYPTKRPPRKVRSLETMTPEQLVATLESPNGWQRDTAQQLLVRAAASTPNADTKLIDALKEMASAGRSPLARLHALCTLDGIDALPDELVEAALSDEHPAVRRHAVRLSEHREVNIAILEHLPNDADAKVRLQLACSLGEFDEPHVGRCLAELAIAGADDPFITAAVMSSINQRNIADAVDAALSARKETRISHDLLTLLFAQAAAVGDRETIAAVFDRLLASRDDRYEAWQLDGLATTLDSLSRRRWSLDEHLAISTRGRLDRAIEHASSLVGDASAPEPIRVSAVSLLLRWPESMQSDLEQLQRLLVPQTPAALQQAIVAHAAKRPNGEIAALMLAGWTSHGPSLRGQILSALSGRRQWIDVLLDRMEKGVVLSADLDASARQRLLVTRDKALLARLKKAFATTTTADRRRVIDDYRSALKMQGDTKRGATIYEKQCAKCHKHGESGYDVGPNLASLTNTEPAALLTSILDPSQAVEGKYLNYVIITTDGLSLSGILTAETGSSLTLAMEEGKQETVLRQDIDELQSSGKSLMPDGIEEELTPQDVSDLIAYVRAMHDDRASLSE